MLSNGTLGGAISFVACIFCSYLLLLVGYRILHHPLREYPGPFAAQIGDGYATFHALRKTLHLATWRDHMKYGPVIRHGPNKLVFNSVTALRDIYHNDRITRLVRIWLCKRHRGVYNIFNSIDRSMHRSKRKLISPVVTDRTMRSFEPTMIQQIDIFLKGLLTSRGAVNVKELSQRLSFDMIGLLSFGYDLRLQTEDTNRFLTKTIARDMFRFNVSMQIQFIPWLKLQFLIQLLFFPMRKRLFGLLGRMVNYRTTQDTHAKKDFYSFVADSLNDESSGTQASEMWSEAIFFLIAGGDTTSTAISTTLYFLSRNPDSYRKLAQEIRSAFEKGSDISGPGLANCRYLRACINEALRLCPPAPGTLWRELVPEDADKPFIVDGHVIPRGTMVGVNIYSLHHNEEYFPEPFQFKPERWLGSSDRNGNIENNAAKNAMLEAFVPFSTGTRSCVGKAMAYLEASLVIAKTMWYFDFDPASGKLGGIGTRQVGLPGGRGRVEEFELFDTLTASHDGPYLTFRSRADLCEDDLHVTP